MTEETYRTAVLHGTRDIRVERLPPVPVTAGMVAVRPQFCGLCGSDLHFYHEDYMTLLLRTPHPITSQVLPTPFGHEFSAIVEEIGPECTQDFNVGDLVTIIPPFGDQTCWACTNGSSNVCSQLGFVGISGYGGGLSERAVVPANAIRRLPKSISPEIGALIEPLSVGWHAITLAEAQLTPQTEVLIIGGGPVGCAVLMCLLAHGISNVTVSEPTPDRREFASSLGATVAITPADLESHTPPNGFPVIFDCAGIPGTSDHPGTLDVAAQAIRAKGTIIHVAVQKVTPLPLWVFSTKEIVFKSSMAFVAKDFDDVIKAVASGRLKPERMITRKIRLEDVKEEGFEALRKKGNRDCKILVDIGMGAV